MTTGDMVDRLVEEYGAAVNVSHVNNGWVRISTPRGMVSLRWKVFDDWRSADRVVVWDYAVSVSSSAPISPDKAFSSVEKLMGLLARHRERHREHSRNYREAQKAASLAGGVDGSQ